MEVFVVTKYPGKKQVKREGGLFWFIILVTVHHLREVKAGTLNGWSWYICSQEQREMTAPLLPCWPVR